jgi:hypothetical protein
MFRSTLLNTDISAQSVDPLSATLIAACGVRNLHPDFGSDFGIPYVTVGAAQALVPITFDYADESDPGPYPIPASAPIEGGASNGGDRHVIVVDTVHSKLYETYDSHRRPDSSRHEPRRAEISAVERVRRGENGADHALSARSPRSVRCDHPLVLTWSNCARRTIREQLGHEAVRFRDALNFECR